MSEPRNQQNYYQEDEDFLETLFFNSEYLIKKICSFVIIISFIILTFLLIFLAPPILQYEINKHKGVNQNIPVIFTVNGENYPDINNLHEFENSGINLDTIPVEE